MVIAVVKLFTIFFLCIVGLAIYGFFAIIRLGLDLLPAIFLLLTSLERLFLLLLVLVSSLLALPPLDLANLVKDLVSFRLLSLILSSVADMATICSCSGDSCFQVPSRT